MNELKLFTTCIHLYRNTTWGVMKTIPLYKTRKKRRKRWKKESGVIAEGELRFL